jgi:hypothetical protein
VHLSSVTTLFETQCCRLSESDLQMRFHCAALCSQDQARIGLESELVRFELVNHLTRDLATKKFSDVLQSTLSILEGLSLRVLGELLHFRVLRLLSPYIMILRPCLSILSFQLEAHSKGCPPRRT